MQVILEVHSGPLAGRKAWLSDQQSIRVGRTMDADFVLANDLKLSGIHFLVCCDESKCLLRDLGSRNETYVNGDKTDEAELKDGDLLYAGSTTFVVKITSRAAGDGSVDGQSAPPGAANRSGIERVVLYRTGARRVSKVWLLPGQQLTVGRNEAADLAVPEDMALSGRHFSVECLTDKCLLRDLGSRNGTWVNGKQVTEVALRDGDKIVASQTTFTVDIAGQSPAEASVQARIQHTPAYTRSKLNQRVTAFAGGVPGQLMEVVKLLGKHRPLYVVVDPMKRDILKSTCIAPSRYLMDWLSEEVIADASPAVLAVADKPALLPMLELSWGNDAAVCFYSHLDKRALTEALRSVVRQPDRQSWSAAGVMACFWPSILTTLLTSGEEPFMDQLFQAVDSVLLESNANGGWTLFAPESFGDTLRRLGFEEMPP